MVWYTLWELGDSLVKLKKKSYENLLLSGERDE
jgi:hypothetical protein